MKKYLERPSNEFDRRIEVKNRGDENSTSIRDYKKYIFRQYYRFGNIIEKINEYFLTINKKIKIVRKYQ